MVVGNLLSYNGSNSVDVRLDGRNIVMENSLGTMGFGEANPHVNQLSRNHGVISSDPSGLDYFPCDTPDNADNNHFVACP
jgi:hypothetical protein